MQQYANTKPHEITAEASKKRSALLGYQPTFWFVLHRQVSHFLPIILPSLSHNQPQVLGLTWDFHRTSIGLSWEFHRKNTRLSSDSVLSCPHAPAGDFIPKASRTYPEDKVSDEVRQNASWSFACESLTPRLQKHNTLYCKTETQYYEKRSSGMSLTNI